MTDTLSTLWTSTMDLFTRFNVEPTLDEQYKVYREEVEEFENALADEYGIPLSQRLNPHDAAHELADVIVTGMKLLAMRGYTFEDFEAALLEVAEKNNKKTLQTHGVNSAGKIARIVK